MKTKEAISILMLSPCYWLLNLPERKELVREFLASYAQIDLRFPFAPRRKKSAN